MPALTPAAAMRLPWGYAMGLINARQIEIERANGNSGESGESYGHRLPPVEPAMSSDGFRHAPGYSMLLGMFKR